MIIVDLNLSGQEAHRWCYQLILSKWHIFTSSCCTYSCNVLFKIGRAKVALLFLLSVGELLAFETIATEHSFNLLIGDQGLYIGT